MSQILEENIEDEEVKKVGEEGSEEEIQTMMEDNDGGKKEQKTSTVDEIIRYDQYIDLIEEAS